MTKKPKLPVLLYEEPHPGEPANPIPYIEIGIEDDMPAVLFVSEYKETGEEEIDPEHGSVAIVDMLIHKYVDMEVLKEKLDPKTNDIVRVALGMRPLGDAQRAGQPILDKVSINAQKNLEALKNDTGVRANRAFSLGEGLRIKAETLLEDEKKNKEN